MRAAHEDNAGPRRASRRLIAACAGLAVAAMAFSPVSALAATGDASYASAVEQLEETLDASRSLNEEMCRVREDGAIIMLNRAGSYSGAASLQIDVPISYISSFASVKDQRTLNSCWAYAGISSLESSYLLQHGINAQRTDAIDFSEAQVVFGTFNGETSDGSLTGEQLQTADNDHLIAYDGAYGYGTPGNWLFVARTLAAGRGVSLESDVPVLGEEDWVDVKGTAESAALQYSLSRFRLDAAWGLPELNVPDDLEGSVASTHRDESVLALWKQAILQQGSVTVLYQAAGVDYNMVYYHPDASYWDAQDACDARAAADCLQPNYWIYNPAVIDEGAVTSGHVVSLVGWDDTYSRWNFATPLIDSGGVERDYDPDIAQVEVRGGVSYIVPKGDGAFIFKNSWGEGIEDGEGEEYTLGNDGLFYVSYWEKSLTSPAVFMLDSASDGSSYDIIQQYDGSVVDAYTSFGDAAFDGANVFTAETDQDLEAVAVWIGGDDVEMRIRVYADLEDPTDPQSGTLVYDQKEYSAYMGYQTIVLDKSVRLAAGEQFSVVASFTTTDLSGAEEAFLPVECSASVYGDVDVKVDAGQSFISQSPADAEDRIWVDVVDLYRDSEIRSGNLGIKALSNPADEGNQDDSGQDGNKPDAGDDDQEQSGQQTGVTGEEHSDTEGQTDSEIQGGDRPAVSDELLAATGDGAAVVIPVALVGLVCVVISGVVSGRLRPQDRNDGAGSGLR